MIAPELTPRQRETLRAAAARILPSGDDGPGARETAAHASVENALRAPAYALLRPWMERGLDDLEARAQQAHGRAFADCPAARRDALLREVEADPAIASRMFFQYLVTLTVEGFLGDPVHGGNRDFLGWRSVGYEEEEPRSGFCVKAEESP